MTKSTLLLALIASLGLTLPASAKMYKWVDEKGTTHYGETIPPEYANRDRTELNKAGRVVKKEEVLSSEERRAKEQADSQKKTDEANALEQKRRDKALVNTFSNTDEIELARSRSLQQVDARLSSINAQLKLAADNLAGLKQEAAARTAAGKKVPTSLQDDLTESEARQKKLQQDLTKVTAEKAEVNGRYDADKARYKALTGK
ncbi:MAG: DUF4124 domain-containing protein [Gallionella sp.]|nr:DUF4124 domain-containing protein [Gallionella sp.]